MRRDQFLDATCWPAGAMATSGNFIQHFVALAFSLTGAVFFFPPEQSV